MALRTMVSNPSGMVLFICLGGLGVFCMCITATAMGVSASKGFTPVSISYIITPTE